jgi:hypothetical protein
LTQAESTKKYRKTRNGLISSWYSEIKKRSVLRWGIPPIFTSKQLREWVLNKDNFDVFNYLYYNWVMGGYHKLCKPSIDRIDCMKQYTFDNMQILSVKDNIEKGNREIRKYRERGVLQISLPEYEIIGRFTSPIDASEKTGFRCSNISRCCRLERKTAHGFKWVYDS